MLGRTHFRVLATLALFWTGESYACSCDDAWELDWNREVVFVGVALEEAQRDWVRSFELGVAVRYRVISSNKLKAGAEVVVFEPRDGPACGGLFHSLGRESVVVAYEVGGVLLSNICMTVPREELRTIREKLGVTVDASITSEASSMGGATLTTEVFREAQDRILRAEDESSRKVDDERAQPVAVAPASAGCAACSMAHLSSFPPWGAVFGTLMGLAARRRRRGRALGP